MSSRETILGRLREANKPFPDAQAASSHLPVSPLEDADKQALITRFIQETEALTCSVQLVADEQTAVQAILAIIGGETQVLAWEFNQIPCPSLESALHEEGIMVAPHDDDRVLFGITGAQAALAATGSLLIVSGPERPRTTSLLPLTHIAVITEDQILPNMEAWMSQQRQLDLPAFQQSANINIISGPSRTADIEMELILGMHGPRVLHIIIIKIPHG